MEKRITIYPENCTGCQLCTLACSTVRTGATGPSGARLWITHFSDRAVHVPVVCTHCEDAWCVEACPNGAMVKDSDTGRTLVREEVCTGCRACTMACPFGAVVHLRPEGKAAKCDECGGEPECVAICPVGALRYEDPGQRQVTLRMATAKRMLAEG